ncbi:glutathione S-transferase N-terminal domain-containing protein [Pseudophaeobacter arcticus]|jgi:glutathione S-transferase|uniref:glutathione S-transferase N-terminal domain-containing protein n=1 Tax=Pseudophaeobacter arcticus TaxID=385492 RepID=UPI003A9794AF
MKLHYQSGACPMASHIALHETSHRFEIEAIDTVAVRTESGADYRAIYPKGYVPARDDGTVLTEGSAILQYIVDSNPEAGLAPTADTLARARMREPQNCIGTELHRTFDPQFREDRPEAGKDEARKAVAGKAVAGKFNLIEAQLADGHEWQIQ